MFQPFTPIVARECKKLRLPIKKAETRTGFGLFEYIAGHIAPLLVTDYSPSAKRL